MKEEVSQYGAFTLDNDMVKKEDIVSLRKAIIRATHTLNVALSEQFEQKRLDAYKKAQQAQYVEAYRAERSAFNKLVSSIEVAACEQAGVEHAVFVKSMMALDKEDLKEMLKEEEEIKEQIKAVEIIDSEEKVLQGMKYRIE